MILEYDDEWECFFCLDTGIVEDEAGHSYPCTCCDNYERILDARDTGILSKIIYENARD